MQVQVKLFAVFRDGRFAIATQDYPPETRIAEVIQKLQIPESAIGMIMLDGKHAEAGQRLYEGAQLAIFPLLGGG